MLNLNILVDEIAEVLQKPFDDPFKAMLASSCIGYRATLIKQEYDKNGKYPLGSEVSLNVPIITVSATECACSDDLECTVRRTKQQIPSPIRGNFKPDPFLYVGNSNMSYAFTYAQPHEIEGILRYNKFTTNEKYYSFYNGYIYTFNNESGKLGVKDVFSNPFELQTIISCSGTPCATTIYIEDDLKRGIKQMVIAEFSAMKSIIKDEQVRINEEQ